MSVEPSAERNFFMKAAIKETSDKYEKSGNVGIATEAANYTGHACLTCLRPVLLAPYWHANLKINVTAV